MNEKQLNAYLERAREIIGERTQGEIDYDDAIVANLSAGMNIKKAFAAANEKYPSEALNPGADHWKEMTARYMYLKEHKAILKRLGIKE